MMIRSYLCGLAAGALAVLATISSASGAAQTGASAMVAARQAGQIGERFDGYLGWAVPPPDALRRQVEAINIRRRSLYANLAHQRSASPQEVAITAGCQLLARVAVGEIYMLNDGVWRRRAPGQQVPVPTYCGQR